MLKKLKHNHSHSDFYDWPATCCQLIPLRKMFVKSILIQEYAFENGVYKMALWHWRMYVFHNRQHISHPSLDQDYGNTKDNNISS